MLVMIFRNYYFLPPLLAPPELEPLLLEREEEILNYRLNGDGDE